jgi:hypothetical protein
MIDGDGNIASDEEINELLADQRVTRAAEYLERPRGILSETDRKFLTGLKDYKHRQSESNRRQSIRERINNSFLDYYLLYTMFHRSEDKKLLEDFSVEQKREIFAYNIAFVYRLAGDDKTRAEEIFERGVTFAESVSSNYPDKQVANCSVDINIEYEPSKAELMKKLRDEVEKGETKLSNSDLGMLIRESDISSAELKEMVIEED